MVVNVGDMLQRLTNGTAALDHPPRASTRRPSGAGTSRYSMPFFLHFRPDFLIETLPGAIAATRRYPPITAHDYLMQRLREIGLL